MKDYYTQQAEDYAGIYKDNDGNVYDLHCARLNDEILIEWKG